MARLLTTGFETGNALAIDGNLVTAVRDTVVARSGAGSLKCASGAGGVVAYISKGTSNSSTAAPTLVAASTTTFSRVYMRFDNAPGSTVCVCALATGGIGLTDGFAAKLTAAGKLQFFNLATGTQIGSDSSATLLMDGSTWYRIEISVTKDGSSNATACELRLDGVTVASTSGLSVAAGSNLLFGWLEAPGATKTCYADDVAVNDATGASQTTWPGSGKIVLLVPISLNTNGGSWTDDAAATTSAALTTAVDNTPPNGVADTTAGGGNHQVRNTGANSSLDMNLTTYAAAGVGALDVVNVLLPIVNVGAPVVTGAKTGSFGVASNPAITNRVFTGGATAAANFWNGAAAGTYPSNWRWEMGTITYAPVVTVGTSPVARLTITGGTTTRVAMCDAMFVYVDYTPVDVFVPRSPAVNFQDPGVFMKALRPAFKRMRDRIFVPELWLPGMPV